MGTLEITFKLKVLYNIIRLGFHVADFSIQMANSDFFCSYELTSMSWCRQPTADRGWKISIVWQNILLFYINSIILVNYGPFFTFCFIKMLRIFAGTQICHESGPNRFQLSDKWKQRNRPSGTNIGNRGSSVCHMET